MSKKLCCVCKKRPAAYWAGQPSNMGACSEVSCVQTRYQEINGAFGTVTTEPERPIHDPEIGLNAEDDAKFVLNLGTES